MTFVKQVKYATVRSINGLACANFHMPFNMLSSNNKQDISGNMKVIRFAQTPKHTLFLIVQK